MKFFEKDELRLLWPFYLNTFVNNIFLIMPIFFIFYLYELNFSLFQISLILAAANLGRLTGEVPTGAIADIYGRKFSVILGYSLGGLLLLVLYFAVSFYAFLAVWFIFWVSMTLISGADQSWVVDNLKASKREKLIHRFYTKSQSFMNASILIGGIVGALFVGFFGLRPIWLISGVGFIISAMILLIPKEEMKVNQKESKSFHLFWKQSSESIKYSKKHKVIFLIMLATFILSASWAFKGGLTMQPLLKEAGIPIEILGYLFSISGAIGMFVPFFAKPLLKIFKKQSTFLGITIIVSSVLPFIVIFASSWISIGLIWVLSLAFIDLALPTERTFLQRFVPSSKRATITSLDSMISSISGIIFLPIAGFFADKIGLSYTIFVGGIITIITGLVYLRIKE